MADNNNKIPFRQLLLQYSNTALNIIFPLVLFPYMTRTLGPEGYGIIGYYESLLSIVAILSSFGVQYFGLKQLSKSAIGAVDQANTVLHLLLINIVMAVAGMLVYLVYVFSRPMQEGLAPITFLYAWAMLIYIIHLDWYFQSQEKFKLIFIRTFIARLFVLIAAFIFVRKPADLIYYILISAINYTFIAGFAIWKIKPLFAQWKWDPQLFKTLIKSLWPFAILGFLGLFYFSFDTILLARIGPLKEVGYYAVAAKIVRIGLNVFTGASVVFFVKLFRSDINQQLQADSLLMTIHLSFPIAAILFFFAEPVILFISGNKYLPSVELLQIFSLLWLIVPFHYFFNLQVFMVNNKEWLILRIFLVASVLSLLLNIVLIQYWQSVGAAWAIVLTEAVVLACFIAFSRGLFRLHKPQLLEIIAVLAVFPIAYLAYQVSHRFIINHLMQLMAGTLITLLLHVPIQYFLFRSSFWRNVKKALPWQKGPNHPV